VPENHPSIASAPTDRDIPGLILGFSCLLFGLAVHAVIPYQVSVEPIPGASQYVSFTPAAVPRLCAMAFVLLGLLQISVSYRHGAAAQSPKKAAFTAGTAQDLAFLAAAMLAYPILMTYGGYALATVCFLLALTLYGGERRPAVLLLCALGVPAAVYLLFGRLMQIPLPEGQWFG